MGLDFSKFEWTPNTIGKNWMSVCNFYGNVMPFLGQTLWQVGPMPFITQGWFSNTNYGNWGDQFVSSYTPGAGGGGGSTNLTEEQRAKLTTQKNEILDYNNKYNAMLKALTEYKKTLDNKAKDAFEIDLSIASINLSSKRSTSVPSSNVSTTIENSHKEAEKAYENLLEIYKEYNKGNAVSKAYEESILEEQKLAKTTNSEYDDEVTSVSNWISAPTDSLPLLEEEDNGSYTWPDNIDIMDFLSTWNSTENKEHLINEIISKYNSLNNDAKGYLETFTEKLCTQLHDRANIINKNELTNSTKNLLKDAIKAFPSSISSSNLNSELAEKFNDLYKAVRLAEAEIADKELREAFDFLGDENPYIKEENANKYFDDAKADLKNEGINVDGVTTPLVNTPADSTPGGNENPAPTPANTPAVDLPKITIDDNVYRYDKEKKMFIDIYNLECTAEELEIEDFVLNEDGKYSYKKGDEIVTGSIQSE